MPPKFVSFLKAVLENQLVKNPYDIFFLETVEGETMMSPCTVMGYLICLE